MAGDENHLAPIVRERIVKSDAGAANSGNGAEAFLNLAVNRSEFGGRVAALWIVQGNEDAVFHRVAVILSFEVAERTREHRRSGDKRDRNAELQNQQRLARERGAAGGAAGRGAQGFGGIGARGKPRGSDAENNSGEERDSESEEQNRN